MAERSIDFATLLAACRPGGSSVLTAVTELVPAAGPHAGVAPARYVRGRGATYAFETRFIPDLAGPASVTVLDSKGSSNNRVESAVSLAIHDRHPILSLTPRIEVAYEGLEPVTCMDLSHRAFDGHIRAGSVDGKPVTEHPDYRAIRDCTAANARPLVEMSGLSVPLGVWDSTRGHNQVRFRSALVGETIGVLADQSDEGTTIAPRGAARKDDLAPSVRLSADDMEAVLATQEHEMSASTVAEVRKAIKAAGKGTTSAAQLGLGAIPPSLDSLGFVACSRIIRSHVLSFAALRQIRFGFGAEGDATVRALLAALSLNGLVRSYAELFFRANCDLVEASAPMFELDARYGNKTTLVPPTIEHMDDVLEEAIEKARAVGLRWEGQVFRVVGNPLIAGGISADADD